DHTPLGFMERFAHRGDGQQHLQRRDNTVACGRDAAAHDMPGVFSTKCPAVLTHKFDHIAVTHIRARKGYTQLLEPQFETKVAHQGAHHTVTTTAVLVFISGNDIQQLIPIDQLTFVIHEYHPITVTVKG